MEIDRVRL